MAVETNYRRAVGAAIREARKAKGLTQRELVEATGVSIISVRNYEAGRRDVPVSVLHDIAQALDLEAAELLP